MKSLILGAIGGTLSAFFMLSMYADKSIYVSSLLFVLSVYVIAYVASLASKAN